MKGINVLIPKPDQISTKPKSITAFWEKIDGVMKQIEQRAFQLFEERGSENGHDWDDWFKAEAELLKPIPVKISDDGNALHIVAEVPGFTADEMTFHLEKSSLTVQGEKQTRSEKTTDKTKYQEAESKMIYRKLILPAEVTPEEAETTLKNGVLEIAVPKAAKELAQASAKAA